MTGSQVAVSTITIVYSKIDTFFKEFLPVSGVKIKREFDFQKYLFW